MEQAGVDWALIVDDGRAVGWLTRAALPTAPSEVSAVTEVGAVAEPLRRSITPQHTLREALEFALTSHTRVAIVQEDGRYLGVLAIERIAEQLASSS